MSITVPPLDETDALVRTLVRALSSHPQVVAWLATDDRIRNFTLVVTNIAEGKTPARALRTLRPSSPFRVTERSGDLPRSPVLRAVHSTRRPLASIDPAGAARLYATLKPRIEENAGSWDRPTSRSTVCWGAFCCCSRRQSMRIRGSGRVEPRGIVYGFADEDLEDQRPRKNSSCVWGRVTRVCSEHSAPWHWHLGFRLNGCRPPSHPDRQ